ncbi:MAG: metallophosphoesterase [Verrucomicrobiota bacterium]
MPFCPSFRESGFTIAALPDLQNYTRDAIHVPILQGSIDWLVEHRDDLDLQLLVQVGDLTNHNLPEEWVRVKEVFDTLPSSLPYALTVGNHDLGRRRVGDSRFTRLHHYFQPRDGFTRFTYPEDRFENSASFLHLGSQEWLILALEFGPRITVIEWAKEILESHPHHPTLLITHEFIDSYSFVETGLSQRTTPQTENSPYEYPLASDPDGVTCGEELWEHLVLPYAQVRLVVNGHYRPYEREGHSIIPADGVASHSRTDLRTDGSRVHQHLINAQWAPRGGDGWLKLFRFSEEGDLEKTLLLSPILEECREEPMAFALHEEEGG